VQDNSKLEAIYEDMDFNVQETKMEIEDLVGTSVGVTNAAVKGELSIYGTLKKTSDDKYEIMVENDKDYAVARFNKDNISKIMKAPSGHITVLLGNYRI